MSFQKYYGAQNVQSVLLSHTSQFSVQLSHVDVLSKDGLMRSGTAYSNLGRTFNYEPLYSVISIDILIYYYSYMALQDI